MADYYSQSAYGHSLTDFRDTLHKSSMSGFGDESKNRMRTQSSERLYSSTTQKEKSTKSTYLHHRSDRIRDNFGRMSSDEIQSRILQLKQDLTQGADLQKTRRYIELPNKLLLLDWHRESERQPRRSRSPALLCRRSPVIWIGRRI